MDLIKTTFINFLSPSHQSGDQFADKLEKIWAERGARTLFDINIFKCRKIIIISSLHFIHVELISIKAMFVSKFII